MTNPYTDDILSQASTLRNALEQYPAEKIAPLFARLQGGEFSRILITGMGSSFNCAYPAYLKLTHCKIPVLHLNAAELLHYSTGLVDSRTLLWMNSQSGRSAEIVHLWDRLSGRRPACLLSMTNDLNSPLGHQANLAIPIHAGGETAVGTKTYTNMLAVLSLAAKQLTGGDWQALRQIMFEAADAMDNYLADWQLHLDEIDEIIGEARQLVLLGRGPSLSAAWNGALNCKEAAKFACEGLHAADFRHGPLELVEPGFTALVFEGASQTAPLNHALALDIAALGGKAIWLANQVDPILPTIELPYVPEDVRMLVEILPIQLLTIALARRKGIEPGRFRNIVKITANE